MLELGSPRWQELDTTYDCNLTSLVSRWLNAVGFDQEARFYDELKDQFLHQGDFSNAAFAILPYLVTVASDGLTNQATEYLTDAGWIEAWRLTSASAMIPQDLTRDYHVALERCPNLADDLVDRFDGNERAWALAAVRPAFHGDGQTALMQLFEEQ